MLYDNAFLFPLKIGISTDEDFLYRQDMIDWIIKYKKDDINNNVKMSNQGGYQTRGNFYMKDQGQEFTTFLDKIWIQIDQTFQNYSKGTPITTEMSNNSMVLQNIWVNVNGPGAFNQVHVHPGSLLSGVLWVKCPEDGGDFYFTDPLEMNTYCLGPNAQHINPIEGQMLIFPACIPHYVLPNTSEEDRISISFNLDIG